MKIFNTPTIPTQDNIRVEAIGLITEEIVVGVNVTGNVFVGFIVNKASNKKYMAIPDVVCHPLVMTRNTKLNINFITGIIDDVTYSF